MTDRMRVTGRLGGRMRTARPCYGLLETREHMSLLGGVMQQPWQQLTPSQNHAVVIVAS